MYLVFDVGATYVKYAWMTLEGSIKEKGKIPTRNKKNEGINDFLLSLTEIYEKYKGKDVIEGIAVGLPGQVDVENGIVYGGGGIRYMHNVPLRNLLSERCDNVKVSIENDGKCAALAEVWMGNAKDVETACVLVFGTGIGGGIIKDGKIHRGKRMLAGELSFIVENMTREDLARIQCSEDMSMYDAIEQMPFMWSAHAATGSVCYWLAKKKGLEAGDVTGEEIYRWARSGDKDSEEALEDMYFSIAKQCCNLYVAFDPEVILIGGGISAEPAFIEGIQRYVNKLKGLSIIYKEISIDVCKYRNDSNLLGALYNFKQIYNV
ncbi:MAG: ROK family protein [Lachnospiraceae bacterium]|nr:ROK family protein [Lachnospiraceae bacterium]